MFVDGVSDWLGIEALAARRGLDLSVEGVSVVAIGGAQAIGRFLDHLGPHGLDLRLAGLCDAGEEHVFRHALERAGVGSAATRAEMERLGFFVCDADLEDELIRAVGVDGMERVVDAQGDLRSFRTLQKQPAQRDRAPEAQLHRFIGSGGGRKLRYPRLLVDAVDLDRVPRPLDLLLQHV